MLDNKYHNSLIKILNKNNNNYKNVIFIYTSLLGSLSIKNYKSKVYNDPYFLLFSSYFIYYISLHF